MSAVQTSSYEVIRLGPPCLPFMVVDTRRALHPRAGREIDSFHSHCAAEYAARLLNAGVATVDPHAIVGCKVVAR